MCNNHRDHFIIIESIVNNDFCEKSCGIKYSTCDQKRILFFETDKRLATRNERLRYPVRTRLERVIVDGYDGGRYLRVSKTDTT